MPISAEHRTVFVTGGAGYIGSVLVPRLLNKGYWVRVYDVMLYGKQPLSRVADNPRLQIIEGDITDRPALANVLSDSDMIIHLAGLSDVKSCEANPKQAKSVNYTASRDLIRLARQHEVKRFIFASSCSVYGQGKDLTEESPLRLRSLYGELKVRVEERLISSSDQDFVPCVLRLATCYGLSPRMRFDLVLNKFVNDAFHKGKITVYGGEQWRPLVHVGDAADAFIACLEVPRQRVRGEIFNIGSNEQNYQVLELAEKVGQHISRAQIIRSCGGFSVSYRVLFNKARTVFEGVVDKKIEDGIKEVANSLLGGESKTLPTSLAGSILRNMEE